MSDYSDEQEEDGPLKELDKQKHCSTTRVSAQWDDGLRAPSNLIPQRQTTIREDQLSDDNLPPFYRKLSCNQACSLLKAKESGNITLTQVMFAEFWPEDSMANGTLRKNREPTSDAYPHPEDLSAKQLNKASVSGNDTTPITDWEKNIGRTFLSAGRRMVDDPDYKYSDAQRAEIYQETIKKKDETIKSLKRQLDDSSEPIGTPKRTRLSNSSLESPATSNDVASLQQQLAEAKRELLQTKRNLTKANAEKENL
ncbi:hypothetical protein EDD36DRAFT_413561 [Exophiala viscosa]|uniref:Uncharacterized protein n=1 Tax=Exophiala viscosa TaxID=2486360 RepID=A0AAN6E4C2_9EURO|nr:hypothetical protein EDD36DRAFT_413561 [Exophiala viscosa]